MVKASSNYESIPEMSWNKLNKYDGTYNLDEINIITI